MILGYPEDTHPVSKEWDGTQQKQLKPRVSGSSEGGWKTNRKETTQIPKLTNCVQTGAISTIGRITYFNLWCQSTYFNSKCSVWTQNIFKKSKQFDTISLCRPCPSLSHSFYETL